MKKKEVFKVLLTSNSVCHCFIKSLIIMKLTFAQVAIVDGITMGGGAGISIPAMFRVVTDKTVCQCCSTVINAMIFNRYCCFVECSIFFSLLHHVKYPNWIIYH